jgi:hypothetical protein
VPLRVFGWASHDLVRHGSALVGRGMELEIVDRVLATVPLRVLEEWLDAVRRAKVRFGGVRQGLFTAGSYLTR